MVSSAVCRLHIGLSIPTYTNILPLNLDAMLELGECVGRGLFTENYLSNHLLVNTDYSFLRNAYCAKTWYRLILKLPKKNFGTEFLPNIFPN